MVNKYQQENEEKLAKIGKMENSILKINEVQNELKKRQNEAKQPKIPMKARSFRVKRREDQYESVF